VKRVVTVLETSGASPQDAVRGPVIAPLFASAGIEARFLGRRLKSRFTYPSWESFAARGVAGVLDRAGVWDRVEPAVLAARDRRIVTAARDADAVHLIKTGPGTLELVEELRRASRARIVYDLGDAMWLPGARGALELEAILRAVDAVTSDNEFTLDFARRHASEVHYYPGLSYVEQLDPLRAGGKPSARGGPVVVGWLGSPSTLFHLYAAWEALEDVARKRDDFVLRIVGSGRHGVPPAFERVRFTALASYALPRMLEELWAMDVGIFPMFDVEEAAARGFSKATRYMAAEAAVIASPRGRVGDVLVHGETGLLAEGRAEWRDALEALIADGARRRQLAGNALATTRRDLSMERCFAWLRKALRV